MSAWVARHLGPLDGEMAPVKGDPVEFVYGDEHSNAAGACRDTAWLVIEAGSPAAGM